MVYKNTQEVVGFRLSAHGLQVYTAVPSGHPSNYEPGATLLNFSDRADTDGTTLYSVYNVHILLYYFAKLNQ